MKRILLKTILIVITFFVSIIIIGFIRMIDPYAAFSIWIIAAGMFAAIAAIWRYNPTSKDIVLKKDDE